MPITENKKIPTELSVGFLFHKSSFAICVRAHTAFFFDKMRVERLTSLRMAKEVKLCICIFAHVYNKEDD